MQHSTMQKLQKQTDVADSANVASYQVASKPDAVTPALQCPSKVSSDEEM
jgi:hypothetical protein